MTPTDSRQPHPLAVPAFFAAVSVAATWPLATQLASRIAFDPGDPFLNTWILWWNAQAVPFTDAWWNPPIFYPMRGALALSENLAGIGFFTTPLFLLGGTPALAYNVALLLSYALSGFFTYLLVRRLTGSTIAALCGGLAFALAPFRAGQLSHLQVLTSQWLPLELLGLHAYIDSGRRSWLAIFGVAWILQGLSNGYYLLFTPALLVCWIAWFLLVTRRWRQAVEVVSAWTLASIPLVPVLLKYRQIHGELGLARSPGEIQMFSAHLDSFLKPSPILAFWPPRNVHTVEDYLFPGLTVVLIVAAGGLFALARRRARMDRPLAYTFLFYVLATLLMAALTFGPATPDDGALGWLKPYHWLYQLPGFDGVRVPVRFGMLMALCLAIAGGLALAMILPSARTSRALVGTIAALGLAIDGWTKPLGVSPPPGRVELPKVPAATVLELPPDNNVVNIGAMFRSMSHRQPLINGYSGHVPPHYDILGRSLRRIDPTAVIELARGRTLLLLIAERNDPAGDVRRVIESIPGIERRDITAAGTSYVLPAQPRDRRPRGGSPHPFSAVWLPRSHVVLDLGAPRVIRMLEFPLRDHYASLGSRIAIEMSTNGTEWTTTFEGWTAGAAIAGALEDQLTVPVRFMLPDITARYLRIHPMQDWMVETLRVMGP